MINSVWYPGAYPSHLPVKQVYGLIFDAMGRILIQDDGGRHNLPGGKPERGESMTLTLIRECLEESQVLIRELQYLGFVKVSEERDAYAQVRVAACVDALLPIAADQATGKTYGRSFVTPTEAIALLNWGEHGRQQIEYAAWVFSNFMQRNSPSIELNELPVGVY